MERPAFKVAVLSRIFIVALQYLINIIIPDHEADAFIYPQLKSKNIADKIVHHLFGGFIRWDAHYFMHIARYGYTYENTLAFFPLYPLIVRVLAFVINSIVPFISLDSVLVLVFIGLNIILFLISVKILFKLTATIVDESIAYKSTLLFCVNPASIFFIAPYSECLFCYLTFQTILNCLLLYKKYSNVHCKFDYCDILYILPLALSTAVRSNGILNIGFLIYTYICVCLKRWPTKSFMKKITFFMLAFTMLSFLTVICIIPFVIYQAYCYYRFCTNFDVEFPSIVMDYAAKNDFILPGQFFKYNQSWCYNKVPLAYSYIQSHYWHVEFLKYYQLKQIPNFILAAPVLLIVLKNSVEHLIHNSSKNVFEIFSFDNLCNKKKETNVISNPIMNVFVIHILFLSLLCMFFVHIQVSTRMLCSASPIIYWYCAASFRDKKMINFRNLSCTKMTDEFFIALYFLSYFVVGTVMFCNFLPWT